MTRLARYRRNVSPGDAARPCPTPDDAGRQLKPPGKGLPAPPDAPPGPADGLEPGRPRMPGKPRRAPLERSVPGKPLERHLQATVNRKFRKLRAADPRFLFRKRHGSVMGFTGDPDLYGLWAGMHWELELKTPGEKLSRLQEARGREWLQAGAIMGVARTVGEVDEFIEDLRLVLGGSKLET